MVSGMLTANLFNKSLLYFNKSVESGVFLKKEIA